ncbi:MAG: hypothetical protein ABI972_10355 [Acidobacteriota bacterium]
MALPLVRRIAFLLALSTAASAQLPQASPQRIVHHFALDKTAVPPALRALTGLARVTASDGATWELARFVSHGHETVKGLWRTDPTAAHAWDKRQYFAGKRYLASDDVLHLLPDQARGVWVRTASAITHIELVPMTLEQKAAVFEERIRLRHTLHGFVADSHLATPGDLSTNQLASTDNDGLWTAIYATAECFRFAVTQSPDALARARLTTEAVLSLETVTGRPGYPARSYIVPGEPRPKDGTWHWTPDGSKLWKSDTSSDELVGHYYLFAIAYDLLDDPALKSKIAATTRRITDHILDHGLQLTDIHGQPTYWGRWTKEYFASPRGKGDAPLNALEILSFLKVAHHITGDTRYDTEYRRLAGPEGYAALTTQLDTLREEINYSDEELAMLPFHLLFLYEKDPALLATYRRALAQWWRNIEREANPLWTLIYSASGAKPDFSGALRTLHRIPMDLVTWTVENSHRTDIEWEPEADRHGRRQSRTLLPPDERPVMKWNGNPFRTDGGNGGRSEDDGAFFLLPYWLARYQKVDLR